MKKKKMGKKKRFLFSLSTNSIKSIEHTTYASYIFNVPSIRCSTLSVVQMSTILHVYKNGFIRKPYKTFYFASIFSVSVSLNSSKLHKRNGLFFLCGLRNDVSVYFQYILLYFSFVSSPVFHFYCLSLHFTLFYCFCARSSFFIRKTKRFNLGANRQTNRYARENL